MTLQNELAPAVQTSTDAVAVPLRLHASTLASVWHWIAKFGGFVLWLLTGFGLLTHVLPRKDAKTKLDEIVVYSVPRSFFLWAIILTGFVAAVFVRHYPQTALFWGWVYVWVLLYTFVTLLFDVSTFKFLLWGGIFTLVWLTSKYLEDVRDMYLLSGVFDHMRSLHPTIAPGFAAVVSWLLLFPWIGGLFASFSRGRKTFSPNSIEEWFLGEGREVIDRSGLKFRSRYRDLFESLLGLGAGDLEAVDANQQVVKRWENVLFLFFHWKRLDQVLHQRAAVVDAAPGETIEVRQAQ